MKSLTLIISICLTSLLYGQDTTIEYDTLKAETEYYGKNIFVKNPFIPAEKEGQFSSQKVIVNGEVLNTDLNATAFEIKLGERKVGEKLKIEIIYIKGSKPDILNLTKN